MLIDSHAHLNFKDFSDDFEGVLSRIKQAEVEKIVNIGTSMTDAQEVIDLANKYDFMFAAVGVHPNDDPAVTVDNIDWEKFEQLVESKKVVAIGECGLDYSRTAEESEKARQKSLFAKQIEIARKLNLSLSIHIREAQEDLMNEFEQSLQELCGVFHCFSGDQKYLNFILLKLPNFLVSFAGNLTFKNAQALRALASDVPVTRLLVETDCPFLTPEPFRGKRNEPANVKITAETLAKIKGLSFEEISDITTRNAEKLFRI